MQTQDIARIRRFFRAVTTEVGALESSFLGKGRPLGVARVLHAVGHYGGDVSGLRRELNLDKAILSRILKGLEDEGLLTLAPDPDDARRRVAHLTEAGQTEWQDYDRLSNAQAETLVSRSKAQEALLNAMDLIASTFAKDRVELVQCDPRDAAAVWCLGQYYAELERRFERGFDVNLSRDPEASDMIHPKGAFFVAMSDGQALGCVGLKGWGDGQAEIKRLWVSEAARGLGLATRLMERCDAAARDLGIKVLRLDTNSVLPEAARLYEKLGWVAIERFNDDPYPDLFFEKWVG
ncbi:GNAT family N-acetyltransferase [Cognatishimia sp.]|uniref:bifunctional helix-turn-helix transcriptional regulator/GNAT family N-acetyltransferase n=1 Tax=Cognatishimia sp. TaxID=2211648 RepID=UPI003518E93C|nr:MarR family transcriptional regulator [Cognatishimia sp.]